MDDEYEEENETGRYKTRIDKEWSKFGEMGFSDVDEKKLEFDLTEGERAVQPIPENTMDWVSRLTLSQSPSFGRN